MLNWLRCKKSRCEELLRTNDWIIKSLTAENNRLRREIDRLHSLPEQVAALEKMTLCMTHHKACLHPAQPSGRKGR